MVGRPRAFTNLKGCHGIGLTVDVKSKTEREKQLIGIIIDNSKVEFSGLERNARDDIRILARAKHLAEHADVETIRPDPGLANMIKRT